MLYDKIIRKYKYIDEDNATVGKIGKIFKEGKFKEPDFPFFKLPKKINLKKNSPSQEVTSIKKNVKHKNVNHTSSKILTNGKSSKNIDRNKVIVDSQGGVVSESFKARLESEKQKSYNQGFQEGRLKGFAEGTARAEQISQVFSNVIDELNKKSDIFFEEIEKWMLDLSVHLAEKIVSEAASRMPDVVKANVDKCLDLLAGSGEVAVKINPADYEIVKGYLNKLENRYEGKFSFLLKPDKNITGGGCLIEMNGSVIDGRIETQLAKIKQQMMMLS